MGTVLKWFLAIFFYHSIMIPFLFILPFLPFMIYSDITNALAFEVPSGSGFLIVLFMFAFWIYLALRFEFLGKIYKKITILLPLAQLIVYISLGIGVAQLIIDSWADNGTPNKGMAIFLAILAFIGVRLLVSLFYWKFPIARPTRK